MVNWQRSGWCSDVATVGMVWQRTAVSVIGLHCSHAKTFHSGETAVATVLTLHFYAQMRMFLWYTKVVNLYTQVLFSPVRKHWLTLYGGHKSVYVYDSLAGSASQATQRTVRQLAGKRARVIYSRTCTQQTKCGDCGCFALAYATTIVIGGNLLQWRCNVMKHLLD